MVFKVWAEGAESFEQKLTIRIPRVREDTVVAMWLRVSIAVANQPHARDVEPSLFVVNETALTGIWTSEDEISPHPFIRLGHRCD